MRKRSSDRRVRHLQFELSTELVETAKMHSNMGNKNLADQVDGNITQGYAGEQACLLRSSLCVVPARVV